jgi:hypothetical protein
MNKKHYETGIHKQKYDYIMLTENILHVLPSATNNPSQCTLAGDS